jgi:hypothetical protein
MSCTWRVYFIFIIIIITVIIITKSGIVHLGVPSLICTTPNMNRRHESEAVLVDMDGHHSETAFIAKGRTLGSHNVKRLWTLKPFWV